MPQFLTPVIFILGLFLALVMARLGFKLMRTPLPPSQRIITQWPKPRNRGGDTADRVPPSYRKSFGLRPLSEADGPTGG